MPFILRSQIPMDPVKREKWVADKNEKENKAYLHYVHRCLLISVHHAEGFGGVRLKQLANDAFDIGEAAVQAGTVREVLTPLEDLLAGVEAEYAEENFLETMGNTYFRLRRELTDIGWNPEAVLWPWKDPFTDADFPQTWRKVTASERKRRTEYLYFVNTMSQLALTLLCMCASALHARGFGAGRLDRDMAPVADRWRRLMLLYLTGDEAAVFAERKAVRDEFNNMKCFAEEYEI